MTNNLYYDTKTDTHYQLFNKGYEIKNKVQFIYLIRKPLDPGNGPQYLQFSQEFFESLILNSEFIIIKK